MIKYKNHSGFINCHKALDNKVVVEIDVKVFEGLLIKADEVESRYSILGYSVHGKMGYSTGSDIIPNEEDSSAIGRNLSVYWGPSIVYIYDKKALKSSKSGKVQVGYIRLQYRWCMIGSQKKNTNKGGDSDND